MNLLTSKYRTCLSSIFLSAYLLSVVGGILHYHHYNFSVSETIETGKNQITDHYQYVYGNNYSCIIQQNLTNLQSALIVLFDDQQLLTDEKIFILNSKSPFHLNQVHLTDNLLRAPPSLS